MLAWISADTSGTVKCLLLKADDNSVFSLEEASPTKNLISSLLHRNREDCYEKTLRGWACLALSSDSCVQLMEACTGGGAKLSWEVHDGRTRDNRHKQEHRKFQLGIKKRFYTVKRVKHWNSVPKRL